VLIRGALAVLESSVERLDILVEGRRIVAFGRDLDARGPVVEAGGLFAGPGFVDIHVHGGGGYSFFRAREVEVRGYAAWAPRHGVTSFLVSTLGPDPDGTAELLRVLRPAKDAEGAEPLGFHLEGPFLNPVRKGAFPPAMLRAPDPGEFASYQEAAGGAIRVVTVAPELPGATELVSAVVATGAVAAMGHSDATAAEARAGFEAGISHVTHLFNAMRPIHQREGGAAVAALLAEGVSCELICDGVHVSEEVLSLALRLLGPARAVAVSDNLEIAGVAGVDGRFGSETVRAGRGAAVRDDGTLVGSIATFDEHFRRVLRLLGGDLAAAFAVCSANPARVAGYGGRKGVLAAGADADIVLLDREFRVVAAFCRGVLAWDGRQEVSRS
jgi:N-acetylglucosamine-6-phosphate deacetylase